MNACASAFSRRNRAGRRLLADKCGNAQRDAESACGTVVVLAFQVVVPQNRFEGHVLVEEIIEPYAESEAECGLGIEIAAGVDVLPGQAALSEKTGGTVSVKIITNLRSKTYRTAVGVAAEKRQVDAAADGHAIADKKSGHRRNGEDRGVVVAGIIRGGKTGVSADQKGALS